VAICNYSPYAPSWCEQGQLYLFLTFATTKSTEHSQGSNAYFVQLANIDLALRRSAFRYRAEIAAGGDIPNSLCVLGEV